MHHVLRRRNKLDDARVELVTSVSVGGLVSFCIPVESLRHLVRQVAHAALPSLAAFDERNVGVDVRPAAAATGDNGVGDDGNLRLQGKDDQLASRLEERGDRAHISRLETAVGSEDESEGELRLLKKGVGGGNGVDGHALVGGIGVASRRLGEGGL
jgi:hypothetical protein